MSEWLKVRNWEQWQSYRSDRGQPPWIKVHRRLMHDPNWITLTDAQRGQLVAIWIVAADRDGMVTADRRLLARQCYMDATPDIDLFVRLGFIEPDANVTASRRQYDHLEAEAEEVKSRGREESNAREARSNGLGRFNELYQSRPSGPVITAEGEYARVIDSGEVDHETLMRRWPEYCRRQERDGLRVMNLANWLRRGGWGDTSLDAEAKGSFLDSVGG